MKHIQILYVFIGLVMFNSCKNKSDEMKLEGEKNFNKSRNLIHEASAAYRNQEFEKAGNLFNEAVNIDPMNPETYSNRAQYKKDYLKDFAGSVADFSASIDGYDLKGSAGYHFQLWGIYSQRGEAKQYLKDYQGALMDYNKAIELRPSIGSTYIQRGIVKYNFLNDEYGACNDWSKAGELGETNAYDYISNNCNN